jgi:flavin reductase (DIM6/NTAB) family NADH-FMN oxidoreductase RutF
MLKSLGARTILYPTPVSVVGTYDKDGKPNVMTAAWVGICCSRPPCIAVSLRKATYTHGNIVERGAFTINTPSEKYIKETDYFGLVSGREADKFSAAKLTPVRSEHVDAPYVKEFSLVLECKLRHTIEIGLHTQFIGEIIDVKADEAILENELPDMKKLKPILYAPEAGKYYGVGSYLGEAHSLGKKM